MSEITDDGLSRSATAAKYRNFAAELHPEAVFADVRALYGFSARHGRRDPQPEVADREHEQTRLSHSRTSGRLLLAGLDV